METTKSNYKQKSYASNSLIKHDYHCQHYESEENCHDIHVDAEFHKLTDSAIASLPFIHVYTINSIGQG